MTPISEIAKDEMERVWLEAMLDRGHGLAPQVRAASKRESFLGSIALDRLVRNLAWAGYRVESLPLGPRGGARWVLFTDDYDEARGRALKLLGTAIAKNYERDLNR